MRIGDGEEKQKVNGNISTVLTLAAAFGGVVPLGGDLSLKVETDARIFFQDSRKYMLGKMSKKIPNMKYQLSDG